MANITGLSSAPFPKIIFFEKEIPKFQNNVDYGFDIF